MVRTVSLMLYACIHVQLCTPIFFSTPSPRASPRFCPATSSRFLRFLVLSGLEFKFTNQVANWKRLGTSKGFKFTLKKTDSWRMGSLGKIAPTGFAVLDLICNIAASAYKHATTRRNTLQHAATRCNTLRHATARCNTLQHAATCCNLLKHAAIRCNTL